MVAEESACNAGDLGLGLWVGKIPWKREQLPSPVFLPGESPRIEEPGGLQCRVVKSRTRLSDFPFH